MHNGADRVVSCQFSLSLSFSLIYVQALAAIPGTSCYWTVEDLMPAVHLDAWHSSLSSYLDFYCGQRAAGIFYPAWAIFLFGSP